MPEAHAITAIQAKPDALTVVWNDGQSARFPAQWLRDCRAEDRDPHSGQRLIDIADLPNEPRIRAARAANGGLELEFEGEPSASHYAADWLREHALTAPERRPELRTRLWLDGAERDAVRDYAWLDYASFSTAPASRLPWLIRLAQDGIAFLAGVPSREGAILEACAQMGRIAETNYGLLFEVRSVARPEFLAYSDHGLGLHTDNPYREPVPGFQALHVLVSSPDGGESLYADGLAIAEHLRATPPEGLHDTEVGKALDAVESPWSRREENAMRQVFEADYPSALERSRALVAEVKRLGIEPFKAPEPLPPIHLDDVHLVAWMAIETDNSDSR